MNFPGANPLTAQPRGIAADLLAQARLRRQRPPMPNSTSRRRFLASAAMLPAVTATAIEPFSRPGAPSLRLSLAAYSFREDFSVPKGASPGAKPRMDLPGFVDFCADNGCEGAELTGYYFPKDVDDAYLAALRRRAHLRGISVSGTAIATVFTHPEGPDRDKQMAHLRTWVDHSAMLGAPHIRVFAGGRQPGQSHADAVRQCVRALEEGGDYAGKAGIFLGLENHGGIVAEPDGLLEVIQAVNNPWVGVNLDTGNFITEDPYADLARCAPYAVNVQFKGEIQRKGAKSAEPTDLPKVVNILREAKYQGWVALEYEMTPDPWKEVPVLLRRLKAAFAA
jgi:sugar phosphate isomerase/epimerase